MSNEIDLSEFAEAQTDEDHKVVVRRLLRQLSEAKAKRDELVGAVYQAATDALSGLSLPPVKKPPVDRRRKSAETAIAVLADWQLSKRTISYDTTVCEERVERYADKIIELTDIQRTDHPVRDLRVYLLGDLIEGELIFPQQSHLIDASLYEQVLVHGPRILGNFIRRMLGHFDNVHVAGVSGNHGFLSGRARKEMHPQSNADSMMYEATRILLQNETRLTWAPNSKPLERNWYAVDYIGEHGFLLFHGDQVKGGFAGFPWYGFSKKIMGWRMGAIPEPFSFSLSGHFHTPVRMHIGGITHWGSGSTESHNAYAAETMAAQGTPSQWLLFCHPERGITAEYECHLLED